MSAPGPESVPTSADPRSHRPTKKRALTPLSAQAASVDALFARPDQNIRLPVTTDASKSGRAPPPEIVTNVQGSSAGAGSGEFHVYKASRRREYERLREMDEEVRKGKGQVEFEKEQAEKDRKDEERTRKNREKREKMKARKGKKGKGGGSGGGGATNGEKKGATNAARDVNGSQDKDGEKKDGGGADTQQNGDDKEKSTAEPIGLVIHDDD